MAEEAPAGLVASPTSLTPTATPPIRRVVKLSHIKSSAGTPTAPGEPTATSASAATPSSAVQPPAKIRKIITTNGSGAVAGGAGAAPKKKVIMTKKPVAIATNGAAVALASSLPASTAGPSDQTAGVPVAATPTTAGGAVVKKKIIKLGHVTGTASPGTPGTPLLAKPRVLKASPGQPTVVKKMVSPIRQIVNAVATSDALGSAAPALSTQPAIGGGQTTQPTSAAPRKIIKLSSVKKTLAVTDPSAPAAPPKKLVSLKHVKAGDMSVNTAVPAAVSAKIASPGKLKANARLGGKGGAAAALPAGLAARKARLLQAKAKPKASSAAAIAKAAAAAVAGPSRRELVGPSFSVLSRGKRKAAWGEDNDEEEDDEAEGEGGDEDDWENEDEAAEPFEAVRSRPNTNFFARLLKSTNSANQRIIDEAMTDEVTFDDQGYQVYDKSDNEAEKEATAGTGDSINDFLKREQVRLSEKRETVVRKIAELKRREAYKLITQIADMYGVGVVFLPAGQSGVYHQHQLTGALASPHPIVSPRSLAQISMLARVPGPVHHGIAPPMVRVSAPAQDTLTVNRPPVIVTHPASIPPLDSTDAAGEAEAPSSVVVAGTSSTTEAARGATVSGAGDNNGVPEQASQADKSADPGDEGEFDDADAGALDGDDGGEDEAEDDLDFDEDLPSPLSQSESHLLSADNASKRTVKGRGAVKASSGAASPLLASEAGPDVVTRDPETVRLLQEAVQLGRQRKLAAARGEEIVDPPQPKPVKKAVGAKGKGKAGRGGAKGVLAKAAKAAVGAPAKVNKKGLFGAAISALNASPSAPTTPTL